MAGSTADCLAERLVVQRVALTAARMACWMDVSSVGSMVNLTADCWAERMDVTRVGSMAEKKDGQRAARMASD